MIIKSALGSTYKFYQFKNHKYKTLAAQSSSGDDVESKDVPGSGEPALIRYSCSWLVFVIEPS